MHSQQYDTRITIQQRQSDGNLGRPSNVWDDVATVWANVLLGSGSEVIRSGQVASRVQASIRIRWRTGINAEMRVQARGVRYSIKAVLPDLRGREHVDLVCEVING